MALAVVIKAILDTPILDEDGNLTEESGEILDVTQKKVDEITEWFFRFNDAGYSTNNRL